MSHGPLAAAHSDPVPPALGQPSVFIARNWQTDVCFLNIYLHVCLCESTPTACVPGAL